MLDNIKIKLYSFYFSLKYNAIYRVDLMKKFLIICSTFVFLLMLIDMVKPDLLRPKSVSDFSTKGQVESEIEYFYKIGKTDRQIAYSRATDIATDILKVVPVVSAIVLKNPILYITYGGASFIQLSTGMILRKIVKEPRPDDPENLTSFPSGHSLFAFTSAITLLLCLRKKKYGIIAIVFAVLIACGRLLANRHYPVDVIVSSLIGCISVLISFYGLAVINRVFKLKL